MRANPLWFVFTVTGIISAYLSMNVSVDYESDTPSPKRRLMSSLIIGFIIAVGLGSLIAFKEHVVTGILVGGIVLICFYATSFYAFHLRTKQQN